ncbi:MAG: discoidin domain-containing protein, partial [Janthinobacterium lividum]
SFSLTTTCPNAPCSYKLNNGPGTISISASGVVSGTITGSAQTYSGVTVTVTDNAGATATSGSLTVVVNAAPAISTPANQQTTISTAATLNMAALVTGGTSSYTYAATNLPSWLTLNVSTGAITGTAPATAATYTGISVTVTDANQISASTSSFSWVVGKAPGAPTAVTAVSGTTTATLSWTAPSDIGGSAITGYTVTTSPSSNGCTSTSATTCTITGLTTNTAYSVTVVATNAFGAGAGSPVTSSDIALNKTTTSSGTESSSFPASQATDGNSSTRWSSAFSDPQWLQVDLGQQYNISQVILNWETAYGKSFQVQTSNDATNWTPIYTTTTGPGGKQTLAITGSGRYLRMYGTVRSTQYGYSLYDFSAVGVAGFTTTSLLSQGKTATASSTENTQTTAALAVDGDNTTRWSSSASDPQSLQVDLGSTRTIAQVVLKWETAYGTAFQIQTSDDASTWTSIYSTTTGTGGTQTLTVYGAGRYVRMYGTARATQYGYSLYEFQVLGN